MRKFTFLLAFLAFSAMTFAQQATIQKKESVNETTKAVTPRPRSTSSSGC